MRAHPSCPGAGGFVDPSHSTAGPGGVFGLGDYCVNYSVTKANVKVRCVNLIQNVSETI